MYSLNTLTIFIGLNFGARDKYINKYFTIERKYLLVLNAIFSSMPVETG